MKLYYRNGLIWNLIYFLIVSIVFLYIVNVVGLSQSPFVFKSLESYLVVHKLLIAFSIVVGISVALTSKLSRLLFFTFGMTCIIYAFISMYYNFSKISIVLTSFYIVNFYYFYQLLVKELKKAYRNPLVKRNEVFDPMLKRIEVKVVTLTNRSYEGYLLNWDEDSCYIRLVSDDQVDDLEDELRVESRLNQYLLVDKAYVVTKDLKHREIGVRFDEEKSSLGWQHFSDIIEMLGYKSEYLK